jgi:hypothetical protein
MPHVPTFRLTVEFTKPSESAAVINIVHFKADTPEIAIKKFWAYRQLERKDDKGWTPRVTQAVRIL